ncbi:rhodanese-like domain-containing protein [Ideonella sp.]|uniref:rhodanese-like domain-containing protein n=1 Tax=Ideonella sp. TaxID=1929293 RepID=UPI002B466968|nr:rhodanese-like domain-containing protein [Ideonella sp.]HJV67726.1 rhodanese-like domain-containing protein [Ideonella sp.]
MLRILRRWHPLAMAACLCWLLGALPANADPGHPSRLVDAAWLQQHQADVLVLDASVTPQHRAGHIPGAVSADLYRYGPNEPTRAAMEQRLQSWGVSPGRRIVVYDQGADMMAARLFYDLYYNGVPADDLFVLDGGLAGWRAHGGAVTQEPTPAPAPGSYRITAVREEVRSRLPEFLVASGDPGANALVEALEPNSHFGATKFFDRAGHVPNAILLPHADFFNADKTFKSADEIRRLARYVGIRPDQVVHSHCGGGVAAAVPWFALRFIAEQPKVKLYLESQREWLRDERGLPLWTYDAPQLERAPAWLAGWNAPMLRMFGAAQMNLIDVRSPEKYAQGHVPFALNIGADTFRAHLGRPEELAALLGPAGVNPAYEVVVMAESGLTPGAALAFLAFEQLGHQKVSVLMDSVDEWGLRGSELTRQATAVGAPKSPKDIAVPAATYAARPRTGLIVADPKGTRGEYPKVFVASGKAVPALLPEGPVVRLPYTELLKADGTPRPAAELWTIMSKAGVPRYAEIVLFADDAAEAAVNYYVFRLMGWPDVKVWVN